MKLKQWIECSTFIMARNEVKLVGVFAYVFYIIVFLQLINILYKIGPFL